jgi:arylsulfatase A-like enzyme
MLRGGLILLVLFAFSSLDAQPNSKPNFIVILTDDQDAPSLNRMPLLRQYAAAYGVVFSRAYVTTPVCCPSRVSLLRGQYVHNHRVITNTDERDGGIATFLQRGLNYSTIATWLNDAGYRTGFAGKYINGFASELPPYVELGWDVWKPTWLDRANFDTIIDRYYRYVYLDNGVPRVAAGELSDYHTDMLRDFAIDFIDQSLASNEPFFLHLAPMAPHTPVIPAVRHLRAFPNVRLPRTPAFNEADVSDKPDYIRRLPPLTPLEISRMETDYRRRLQMLLAVDEMVATIVRELERRGQLANTYIIYTSDKGYVLGERRGVNWKLWPYEESSRVPFVVIGGDTWSGVRDNRLVLNIDIAPTLADLAGVDIPDFVDGRSFAPLLRGEAVRWRSRFMVENLGSSQSPGPGQSPRRVTQPYSAVFTHNWRSIYYTATGERELYYLPADPYQLNNIYPRCQGTATVRVLDTWMRQLRACAGARCHVVDQAQPEPPPC